MNEIKGHLSVCGNWLSRKSLILVIRVFRELLFLKSFTSCRVPLVYFIIAMSKWCERV